MKRFLLWFLAVMLLLVLAIPTGLYFAARSEAGSRALLGWIVDFVPVEMGYQDVRGNLLQGLIFTDFQIASAGVRISADELDIAWQPQLLMAGNLHFEHLRISNLAIEVAQAASVEASSTTPWPEVAVPLRLTLESLSIDGFFYQGEAFFERLELAGSIAGSSLHLDRLEVQRAEANLELSGDLRLAGRYPLSLELQWNYLLEEQTWSGSAELEGNLVSLRLNHRLLSPYQIDSELIVSQPMPSSPGELSLEALRLEGVHSAEQLDLRNLLGDWALFSQVEFETRGGIEDLEFSLGTQTELPWLGATTLASEGNYRPDRVLLDSLELDTSRGAVQAQLEYQFESQQIDISHLEVSDFEVSGTLNPLTAEAWVQVSLAPELTIAGELVSATIDQSGISLSAKGPFSFRGGELSSPSMELLAGENRFATAGRLFPDFQLEWRAQAPDLGPLLAELTSLQSPSLSLQGTGNLQGTYEQPELSAVVEATQINLAGFTAELINLELIPGNSGHRMQLSIPRALFQNRELREFDAHGLVDLESVELEVQTRLDNLELQLGGRAMRVDSLWKMNLQQLDLQGPPALGNWALESSWNIEQLPQGWRTDRVCWSSQEASLCAEASSSDQQLGADLALDNLPLDFLQYVIAVPLRIEGRLAGDLHLQQRGEDTSLDLNLSSTNGSFLVLGQERAPDPVTYQQLQVSATMRDQILQASASVELGDYGRGRASGNVDFSSQQPQLEAELTVDIDSMQWIEGVVTQVDNVRGDLELTLRLQGLLSNPAFNLSGELTGGSLMIPQAGIELTELEFSARPSAGDSMNISASAKSGEGAIRLEGELWAPALDAIRANASLSGENFQLLDRPDMRLRVNPEMEFELSPGQAMIQGRLVIPQARAQVRQLPAGGVRPSADEVIIGDSASVDARYLALVLDLELELGSDVEFQGFGLTTGLRGSLEIQQPLGEPQRTFGTIELVDGEYQAYGRSLVVQRGRMIFQGEIDNPGLDVDAEQSYLNYRVGIHLGGTALSPTTTLYSSPTMTQSDILAVLLTGQRLATMSASEAPTLLSAATQLGLVGGASIAERIEENFGLSEFGVRNDAQNGQSIVAGTYLLPRLYVEWAQGLFEPSSSLELEYRISDQWKLKARSGASQSMDLIYEIETQ